MATEAKVDPQVEPQVEAQVEEKIDQIADTTVVIFDKVGDYASLVANSLLLIIASMLVIFILHRLAAKWIYPHTKFKRVLKVFFGTLYVLVIVVMALLLLERVGIPIEGVGKLAILGVLVGAVIVFFLVPFLPRLPFMRGHVVDLNGVFGTVVSISTLHTTIRKFDGTMAFIPNALIMAQKILNYSDTPSRRIELFLSVNNDSDLEKARATFIELMSEDARVLEEPSPPVTNITNVTASGVDIVAWCWVNNADWFATRTDLWLKVVERFRADESISMSLPQQEILFHGLSEAVEQDHRETYWRRLRERYKF
jgi:small conductance mechanosensitive channel